MKRTLAVAAAVIVVILLVFFLRPREATPPAHIEPNTESENAKTQRELEARAPEKNEREAPAPAHDNNAAAADRLRGEQERELPKPATTPSEPERKREHEHEREPARAEAEQPKTDGGVSIFEPNATGIRDAVRASIPELKDCYESWLKMSPELKGKTTFSFAISANEELDAGLPEEAKLARITDVKLQSSSVGHAFMEGCIARVFEDLRFRPPEGGKMNVTYPLTFDNEQR